MSDAPPPRNDKLGGILVGLFIVGSAVGVVGWYLQSNSGGKASMDTSGFDVTEAPPPSAIIAPPPTPSATSDSPAVLPAVPVESSLRMLRVDENFKPVKPSTIPVVAVSTPVAAPAMTTNVAATATTMRAPAARKTFVTPKLSGGGGIGMSSGFGNAVGSGKAPAAAGAPAGGMPAGAPAGMPDISAMLKGVPGGASNPEVQKAMQGAGGK